MAGKIGEGSLNRIWQAATCLLAASVLAFTPISGAGAADELTIVADEWPPNSGEALPGSGMSPDIIASVLQQILRDFSRSLAEMRRDGPLAALVRQHRGR